MLLTSASRDSFRSASAICDWTKTVGNLLIVHGGFDEKDACGLTWLQ